MASQNDLCCPLSQEFHAKEGALRGGERKLIRCVTECVLRLFWIGSSPIYLRRLHRSMVFSANGFGPLDIRQQFTVLDAPGGLRDINPDTKNNLMKTRIFSLPLVAIAGVASFGYFAMSAAGQNSSTSTTTPNVTVTASGGAGSPVELSSGAAEVLKLGRAQVNDDTIVAFVGSSKRTYNLSANEIIYLREQGVSDHVLTAMLDQRKRVAETAVASTVPQTSNPDAASAPYAPIVAQPSATYVQPAPVYVSPTPVYSYPVPTYSYYYDSYPYYGSYWGFPFPAVTFGFGFRGGFHGGGFHGGGFHARSHR